ncbi:hypothetical protein ABVT39_019852 [Epinephelus coioides]
MVLHAARGEGYVGHVPSRRPSHSASTSGFNPPWRTWQIALATPAHSAAGVVAAWPGPAHQPAHRPRSLRGSRALEVKQNESVNHRRTALGASLLSTELYSIIHWYRPQRKKKNNQNEEEVEQQKKKRNPGAAGIPDEWYGHRRRRPPTRRGAFPFKHGLMTTDCLSETRPEDRTRDPQTASQPAGGQTGPRQ